MKGIISICILVVFAIGFNTVVGMDKVVPMDPERLAAVRSQRAISNFMVKFKAANDQETKNLLDIYAACDRACDSRNENSKISNIECLNVVSSCLEQSLASN